MSLAKAKSICCRPGCPNIAVRRGLCEQHAKEVDAEYRKKNPDTRPSAAQRGYDAKWRKLRAAYLRSHPGCEWPDGCDQAATDVDHIVSLQAGGRNEWRNLQALCHSHHSTKTYQYDGGFGNRSNQQ